MCEFPLGMHAGVPRRDPNLLIGSSKCSAQTHFTNQSTQGQAARTAKHRANSKEGALAESGLATKNGHT